MLSITSEQFEVSKQRLEAFLEDKYKIKNQSEGLIEFAAAHILGFDNHHQLKSTFSKNQKPNYMDMDDDTLFAFITADENTTDIIIECNLASEFEDHDMCQYLRGEYDIDFLKLSNALRNRLLSYFNQLINWEIRLYKKEGDLHPEVLEFIFKHDALSSLSSLHKDGQLDAYGKITIRTQDGEESDSFSYHHEITTFIKNANTL